MKTKRKNKWGELLECLAVEELQIVLLEVLFAAEEDPFRFGKAFRLGEFGSGEFKRTGEIRNLKEPVFRRLDFGNELGAGGVDRECLLEKRSQVVLTVVIIDLQLVIGIELRRVRDQELDDLLEQRIVNVLTAADMGLVDAETLVGDIDFTQEPHHASEDTSSLFTAHFGVLFFTTNQGTGVDALVAFESHVGKRGIKAGDLFRKINVLVVEDHADQIAARRTAIRIETPRFVDKDTDLFCGLCHRNPVEITKARIAPRHRQETFPRAGDSGFRPCRRILNQKKREVCKGVLREVLKKIKTKEV